MQNNSDQITKIAIVGGGFGGIEVFKKLQNYLDSSTEINLFNARTDFIFTPLLHEAATGGVNLSNIAAPIRSFIKKPYAEFVHGFVHKIDINEKYLISDNTRFDFDYIAIATGSVSDTRDTKGADDYCYFLKTVEDSVKLRKAILGALEKYSVNQNPKFVKFTVIGGGSTGVELSLEIDEYVRYTLSHYYKCPKLLTDFEVFIVCPSSEVLTGLDSKIRKEAMSRLSKSKVRLKMETYVSEVGADYVKTNKGEVISSSINIWCGGVRPLMPELKNFSKDELTPQLNLLTNNKVFLLGDNVNFGTSVPMDAQAAVKQADVIAYNIYADLNYKPLKEFHYNSSGTLVSLGRWHAAGKLGSFFIRGPIAWWIWRTIYLFKFPLPSKRIKIAIDWTVSIFSGRDISNV